MVKKYIFGLSLGLLFAFNSNAQKINANYASKYTMEVYKNTEYASEKHIAYNKTLIERVEIKKIDAKNDAPGVYSMLSTIEMMDKYNTLTRDNASNFSPSNFNPLKYRFNFYSKSNQTIAYRVDNTNYYIIIHPSK